VKAMNVFAITLLLCFFPTALTFGQSAGKKTRAAYGRCSEDPRLKVRNLKSIRKEIHRIIDTAADTPLDAYSNCVVAELMKRVGDSRATHYYQAAINADDSEPEWELLYADYLRNFRGAQRPLFHQAERHYLEALSKLKRLREDRRWNPDYAELQDRVERGLVALFQQDGVPLLHSSLQTGDGTAVEKPAVLFASINRASESINDFDRVDDVRALTSEALFSSSRQRQNKSLSDAELFGLVRSRPKFETLNRVRFRPGDVPVLDVFYTHRQITDAQVTSFFRPGEFNDFRLREFGVALEESLPVAKVFDLYLRGSYKRSERRGLIEFFPGNKEHVDQFEATAAMSRFVGPDKAVLESVYLRQNIHPDQPNPPSIRNRQIIAATFTYQIFRPLPFLEAVYGQRFETRGLHLSGGAALDQERFGATEIQKRDFFVGASLRGLGRFDFTLQPTVFKARVTGDKSQTNSQYRTNFNVLYRFLDEEREPGIPDKKLGVHWAFVHLVVPLRHDITLQGLNAFENFDAGVQLDTKFFTTGRRRTTFLTSVRYEFQRFYKLNRNLNSFGFSIGMGF
jgi:hypothetical protein